MTYRNNADGASAGSVTTAASTAYPDAFTSLAGSANSPITFDSDAAHGSMAYKIAYSSGNGRALVWSGLSTDRVAARVYFKLSTVSVAAQSGLLFAYAGGTAGARVYINTAAKLIAQQATGATLSTSPNALTAGVWYRLEMTAGTGTSASSGTISTRLYEGDSTTAIWTYDGTGLNTGYGTSATWSNVQFGRPSGTSYVVDVGLDDMGLDVDSLTLLGVASASNAPPVVSAGDDSVARPGATVTLTGTATDSDGTIASTSWTQTAGPTVTLAGSGAARTFTAPAVTYHTPFTFAFTATDNAGASTTDSVTVTVLGQNPTELTGRNTAEGGAVGPVTNAAATALPDPFTTLAGNTGSSISFAAEAAHGSIAYKIAYTSGNPRALVWSGLSAADLSARAYFKMSSVAAASQTGLLFMFAGTTAGARVYLTTASRLICQAAAGTTLSTSPDPIVADTWYRLDIAASTGTSASSGKLSIGLYRGDNLSPLWSYSGTGLNTGYDSNPTFGNVQFGDLSGASWARDLYLDDLGYASGQFTLIGPVGNEPPIVGAGLDRTVGSYSTVTLAGSASDVDGTIESTTWTQTAGPAVTLAGSGTARSFKAPGVLTDTPLTFRFTAVDDAGGTASDTVTITVIEAQTRVWDGEQWKPAELLRWDGAAWV